MKKDKKKYKFKGFGKGRKKFVAFLIVLALLAALGTWVFAVASDVYGWDDNGEQVMVQIPDGCSMGEIAEILKKQNVIDYVLAFRLYVKVDGGNYVIQKGGHLLNKNMSYDMIIKKITEKPDAVIDDAFKLTVPEGYEVRQIADKLAEAGLVDRDKFIHELEHGEFDYSFVKAITRTENRLEGYLYPATYDIYPGDTEHDIICKMLDSFEKNIVPLYEASGVIMPLDEVVTFASIVEREAANDEERGIVASVFYNRMAKDMTLSSCASVQYILKERKKVLGDEDVKIESPYNTYIHKGLPVGPVASPGINSVKAVLSPAKTNYLYFAAKADGSANVFAETDAQHMENVKVLQGK